MKLALLSSLCSLLMQLSIGRVVSETQLDSNLNLEYRAVRGVTSYTQPPSVPDRSQTTSDTTSGFSTSKGQILNYDILKIPDERLGGASGPVRVAPALDQSAGAQLPPKFGPVLFPDEEAAAQNNENDKDGKSNQGGQNNENTKNPPVTVVNPPQDQGNSRNNGNKSTGGSQRGENSSGNRDNNSSNRNGNTKSNESSNNGRNGGNGNIYGNNGNGNGNGRGNGRKNCLFPLEIICILGR